MNYAVPMAVAALLLYAAIKKVDCYAAFTEGAADALPTLIKLLPNLAAMLAAIAIFRASGAADLLARLFAPLLGAVCIPSELAGLLILRPLSGSGALAMLTDLLREHGPDSFIGLAASVCVGSTETIFYTLTVYCAAAGIRKARYAPAAALLSGLVGAISGIALVRLMF